MAKIVHSQIEVKPAKASQGSHGPLRLPQTQNASARFFRTLLGVYLGNGCCLRKTNGLSWALMVKVQMKENCGLDSD